MDDTVDLLQIKIENAKRQLSKDALDAIAAVPWQAEIIKMRETRGYSFEQLGNLEMETELVLCGLLSPKDYPREIENRMRITKAQANELVNEINSLVFSKIKEELIKITERKNIFAKKTTGEENNVQAFKEHGIEILGDVPPPLNKGRIQEGSFNSDPLPTPPLVRGGGNTLPVPEKLELNSPLPEYSAPKAERGGVFPPSPSSDSAKATPDKQGEGSGVRSGENYPPRPDLGRGTPEEGNNNVHPMLAQKLSASVQTPIVKTEHTPSNLTPSAVLKTDKPKIDPYREIPE